MKLTKKQTQWIADEFIRCERTLDEITLDTGLSNASVKRALSEEGVIDLSWHKSEEQHQMLKYLRTKNIVNLTQLKAKL